MRKLVLSMAAVAMLGFAAAPALADVVHHHHHVVMMHHHHHHHVVVIKKQ
jgi:hypothetical protein